MPTKTTPRTAAEAVAWARDRSSWRPKGLCANYVASCYTDGLRLMRFGIEDANDAWAKATQRESYGTPPAGAPVHWAVGLHGHIAISVGGGRVRSTDYPRNELLGECTLAEMGQRWPGMTYLGWTRDLAGYAIPGLEDPTTREEEDMFTEQDSARLARVEQMLTQHEANEAGRAKVAADRNAVDSKRFQHITTLVGTIALGLDRVADGSPITAEAIADAIPDTIAQDVVNALAVKLQGVTQ